MSKSVLCSVCHSSIFSTTSIFGLLRTIQFGNVPASSGFILFGQSRFVNELSMAKVIQYF